MSNKRRTEYRFRGVRFPTSSHPDIRRIKRQGKDPAIHGNKLWKSSCLLIDYLRKNPPEQHRRVLDVGCGWGIGGIWCAKEFGAQVTSVDADPEVFPYLDATAQLNGVSTEHKVSRFERLTKRDLQGVDLMIAADICFWDELVDPVSKLINRAIKAGVKQILIADPERAPFFEVAERAVEKHCGEVLDWHTSRPIKAQGSLLLIHNA